MELRETNALVAWINQMDPLVSNTMAAVDNWHASIGKFPLGVARQAVFDHYRLNERTPAEPAGIRKRCGQLVSLSEARQRARMIDSPKPKTTSLRERNPELWEQLVEAGKAERAVTAPDVLNDPSTTSFKTRPAASAFPVVLEIPAPDVWLNSNDRRHRQAEAKITKTWRAAGKQAATGLEPFQGRVHMTATIHKTRDGRWDPNNLWPTIKAIVDGIVEAGVLADDDHKHVIGPDMRRGAKGPATVVIEITPIA